MPLYEYHCEDCGADFEALVSFREADQVECELCHGRHVTRLNSSFSCSGQERTADGFSLPGGGCSSGG